MKTNWIDFLKKNSLLYKDKIAIVDQQSNERISYNELYELSLKHAVYLKEQGVEQGDTVALLATNELSHITLLFASAYLGAILTPINFRLSKNEINEIINKISPKLSITQKRFSEVITNSIEIDKLTNEISKIKITDQIDLFFTENKKSNAETNLLLFTSGTTGSPKGVELHGEMLETNQDGTAQGWELRSSDITMIETPFFHTGGYNVLCLPLLKIGGTVVLAEKFDLENVFKTIEKEKVTVYFAVPTMFQLISEHPNFPHSNFDSIRFFISGGAACSLKTIENYQKRNLLFKQGFGLTEVGPNCFLLKSEDAVAKIGSIGKPMNHTMVKVVTLEEKQAKENEIGELYLKGKHLCNGYYKQKKLFEESCSDGYFKTGDLVSVDRDGFYYVKGRIKDMYISGGENVYPAEVEKQLMRIEKIVNATIVSVPDSKWGEVGYCFIQTKDTAEIQQESITLFLNDNLSRYKHPKYIKNLKDLPLLANGKIDKKMLKQMAIAHIGENEHGS